MADQDDLLAAVGRIYDAALDEALWPEVLNDVADLVGGTSCHFFVRDAATNTIPLMQATRTDPVLLQQHADYYINVNPWIPPFLSRPSGSVMLDDELIPRDEIERSEFFNDHLRPRNVSYALGAVILKSGPLASALTVYRNTGRGTFDESALRIGRKLVPHLQRAVQLAQKLGGLAYLASGAVAALDGMPYGVLLLNGSGKVLHANRVALDVLAQRDGLWLERGDLCAGSASDNQSLRRQIRAAAGADRLAMPPGSISISRPSMARPFALMVAPFNSEKHGLFGDLKPEAIVFLSDPERAGTAPAEVVRQLYRLTGKEAEVALMIAQGRTLQNIADCMGIRLETVRSYLKRVLEKTQTNRQVELVRLILSGPARIRLDQEGY